MKLNWITKFSLISIIVLINCNCIFAENNIKTLPIDGNYIKFYGEAGLLDIQYTNIIFKTNSGKEIAQPVFRGNKGNIAYEDLRQYCIKMGKLKSSETRISPIQVYCKKGKVKKTFHEFLAFYKTNLFKDIDIEHPTRMVQENDTWLIRYDFKVNGVPGNMQIQIDGSEGDYKSVYNIPIDENGGWFVYDISIRRTAP